MLGCRTDNAYVTVNLRCEKQCFIKKKTEQLFNVFYVRGDVSSAMGKGGSVETEKTGKEHYILWLMTILRSSISAPLRKLPSTISSPVILGSASPVPVATSDVNTVKTGISPKRALRNWIIILTLHQKLSIRQRNKV